MPDILLASWCGFLRMCTSLERLFKPRVKSSTSLLQAAYTTMRINITIPCQHLCHCEGANPTRKHSYNCPIGTCRHVYWLLQEERPPEKDPTKLPFARSCKRSGPGSPARKGDVRGICQFWDSVGAHSATVARPEDCSCYRRRVFVALRT